MTRLPGPRRKFAQWAACLALTLLACSEPPNEAPGGATGADPNPSTSPPPSAETSPESGAGLDALDPLPDPLSLGSQAARDDLYCAGLIMAAYPDQLTAVSPVEVARTMKAQNLALMLSIEGSGKLIDEGLAQAPQTGAVATAWGDAAYADLLAGTPRIALDACMARAEAAAAPP